MIEDSIIVSKLQAEGIDEKLATGVQFETEEALNAWVGNAKTFVTKPKDISEYNEDELRRLADEGKVKPLQSAFDKIRAEAAAKFKKPDDTNNPLLDTIRVMKEEVDALKAGLQVTRQETEAQKFDLTVEKYSQGLDPYEVNLIKSTLSTNSAEADVKKSFEDYRSLMVKRGLTSYKPGDSSEKGKTGGLGDGDKASITSFIEREKAKKEKNNLKK